MEDACLGLCFEVHRAVKCGYFFLDDTDPDSMKDFGEPPKPPRAGVMLVTGTQPGPCSQRGCGGLVVPTHRDLGLRGTEGD